MTQASTTIRVSKNVASRHDASGLRVGRKNTAGRTFQTSIDTSEQPLGPWAKAVTWIQRRSVRLKAESSSTDCSAASMQNPIRLIADSGLLEQRI